MPAHPRSCRGVPQFVEHALPGLGGIDAQVAEGLRGLWRKATARVALSRVLQAEQQVLGADVVVMQARACLSANASDCFDSRVSVIRSVNRSNIVRVPSDQRTRARRTGWLASARRACFLCAACRETPRISAISCQDQPCSRALSTWSASSCSSSLRRAATARSPVRGSELSAAAAKAGAFSIVSIYVDTEFVSTWVDTGPPADYEALTRAG